MLKHHKVQLGLATVLAGSLLAVAMGQESEPSHPRGAEAKAGTTSSSAAEGTSRIRVGEVTVREVNVRSGPSTNYYVVLRLKGGDRVGIVGETPEWYQILPPKGAFSLIFEEYVDTADGKHGVVNGNNVNVRAGSALTDQRYARQGKLSSGAEVTILGRTEDGYYKIVPPKQATLYINREYVGIVPGDLLQLEHELAGSLETQSAGGAPAGTKTSGESGGAVLAGGAPGNVGQPGSETEAGTGAKAATGHGTSGAEGTVGSGSGAERAGAPTSKDDFFHGPYATEQRKHLLALDDVLKTELAKPLTERAFSEVLAGYQAVAEDKADSFAQRYALARVTQVENMSRLIDAVRTLQTINDDVESRRQAFVEARALTGQPPTRQAASFDAVGELRHSAIYSSPVGPHRYRLVDSTGKTARTIAYIEIPPGSRIDAESLLGRRVGVRAVKKRLAPGMVNPVPIYVAGEIVPLPAVPDRPETAAPTNAGDKTEDQAAKPSKSQ